MENSEFNIEEFKKNSAIRRKKQQRYLLIKEDQRKKRIKVVKRFLAGGAALTIFGIGVIKANPAIFSTFEAKGNGVGYRNSQMLSENGQNKAETVIENIEKNNYIPETISGITNNQILITEGTEEATKETEKTTKPTEKATDATEKATESKTEVKMTVGGNGDDQVAKFLNTETGQYVYYYSDCYGVDPNIIASICMQETSLEHERCCPGGDRYSGYGVGICQLESPDGSLEVTAHNYKTGEDDTLVVSMENACDVETNIQIACAEAQNSLNNFNGNPLMAIQSHNYGKDMLNLVLNNSYSDPQSIINDYSNISWIEYVQYAHANPGYYITNWEFDSYGDGDYVYHVLSHCPSKEISYIYNNQRINFRLDTLETTKIEDINTHTKTN